MAVIEFARAAGMDKANSTEFDPGTPYPVIDLMPEQNNVTGMGGTMRLGAYPCKIDEKSKAYEAYGETLIHERHRHRYEVSNDHRQQLAKAGMKFSGVSPDGRFVEIVELEGKKWFLGVQFHPEFKSRPNNAHPLFRDFISAAMKS
jgi:CTP synthase